MKDNSIRVLAYIVKSHQPWDNLIEFASEECIERNKSLSSTIANLAILKMINS